MTVRLEFEVPRDGQFPRGWKGSQQSVRFMLDQADGLIEAIKSGRLKGTDAATELQLMTCSAMTDAHTAAVRYQEQADYERNKEFWDYALAQAEKARKAFDKIKGIPHPSQKEEVRIFKGQRCNCDDHVQFFRNICTKGVEATINEDDDDMGHNPFVGRG